MEFNSMLHEIKLYESLKRQLKNKAKISSKVHVDAIREQIKEDDRKNNEVRFEFERKLNGFSLFISRHKF